ncbi:MAG: hypothetical protein H6Q66_386 [Firmicutes bacterium]|nr:hypothetical protein [Bacillota bacterium]
MLKYIKNSKGSVVIIVAAAMVVMLGFAALVIDVGAWYNGRVQLSNLADAAALAGAQDLPDTAAAEGTARVYAAISPPGHAGDVITVDAQTDHITVDATRVAPSYFARVLGINNVTITAHARVNRGVAGSARSVVPLGYVADPDQPFPLTKGVEYPITLEAGEGTKGNYLLLDFPVNPINIVPGPIYSSAGGDFMNYIMYGYGGTIQVNSYVWSNTGLKVGQVSPAINYRVGDTVIVPVITKMSFDASTGKSEYLTWGFAAFQVTGYSGKTVKGKFLEFNTSDAGPGGNPANLGLSYMRLVE